MAISRTPFRISFFGGGTDYPSFFREHGGSVLSTTINKYCYITARDLPPFFDHRFRIRYTHREQTQTVEEIAHPSVRECLKFVGFSKDVEMLHTSDIPAMSGIGSSSSFTVGFLNALYALKGRMVTKRQLAFDAIKIEQERIHECVGSQDQTAAAFGGFNRIDFHQNGNIFVQPATISSEKLRFLQENLMFIFTGQSRIAAKIAQEQIQNTSHNLRELKAMQEMVDQAVAILNGPIDNLVEFGQLLHESWMLKRALTSLITNEEIDQIYQTARDNGAIGGKLCGAGGGGFLLLFVPPVAQLKVKAALKHLLQVPFHFETLGSHIIFYAE